MPDRRAQITLAVSCLTIAALVAALAVDVLRHLPESPDQA